MKRKNEEIQANLRKDEEKMANIVGLDLNIDQDYLAEAVRQTVITGISESLNGKNEIVSQIVKMTLSTKVSDTGTISSYERDNKYTLLEYHVKKMISEVTAEELQKIVYTNEIADLVVEDSKADDEIVYAKTVLDRRIREIVGEDNFSPFDERYGRR